MAQRFVPSFSQAAIEAFRDTPEFEKWNRGFEILKRKIRDRVSPKDTQPLVRAGAEEDRIFSLLALVVYDSKGLSTKFMARRESLGALARDLEAVTNRAERSIQDPLCDGRFWLALEGFLSWDLVPQPGSIEAPALGHMRGLARLVRDRGNLLGKLSRDLKKLLRNRDPMNLIGYVEMRTGRQFDTEIAYLLRTAYKAAGTDKCFTADQIKKFRQRHVARSRNAQRNESLKARGVHRW